MAFKINTNETLEVEVNGQTFNVAVPSLKKFSELEKKLKELEPEAVPDFYSTYFESLGLPKAVSDQFTLKNWKSLIEEITGSKKQ